MSNTKAVIKDLKAQIKSIDSKLDANKEARNTLTSDKARLKKQLDVLQNENGKIWVNEESFSDHAMIRLIERVFNFELIPVKTQIAQRIKESEDIKPAKDGTIGVFFDYGNSKFKAVVKRNTVITIIPQ